MQAGNFNRTVRRLGVQLNPRLAVFFLIARGALYRMRHMLSLLATLSPLLTLSQCYPGCLTQPFVHRFRYKLLESLMTEPTQSYLTFSCGIGIRSRTNRCIVQQQDPPVASLNGLRSGRIT